MIACKCDNNFMRTLAGHGWTCGGLTSLQQFSPQAQSCYASFDKFQVIVDNIDKERYNEINMCVDFISIV